MPLFGALLCSAAPARAAEPPPEFRSVLGKQIWFAPHAGCLDRLRVREGEGKTARWARRYPEHETVLKIRDLVNVDGRWSYRFDWNDGGGAPGYTPADRVVADTRFEAQPTTFYRTCFFLERPQALAGYLRAEHPQALQRYGEPTAAERQREIMTIESRDRRSPR
ncbi:MAG: hypothetical protein QM674_19715 [Burkholderiaceae bacterium]